MAKKTELNRDAAKEYAFTLFMANAAQKEISEKVGISKQTINRWVAEGGWSERRAAKTISRTEISNKILKSIADEVDKLNEDKDAGGEGITAGVIDKLTKMAAMIEKLDKKAGVVESVNVFIAFARWLSSRAAIDKELTNDFLKQINSYQDKYINEMMANKTLNNE